MQKYRLQNKEQKHFSLIDSHQLWHDIKKQKFLRKPSRQLKTLFISSFWLLSLFTFTACQGDRSKTTNSRETTKNVARLSTELTLDDAVLEQADRTGNLVWKIKARRTTYSDDRKVAYLENITANLLQDKKIILKLQGKRGEIQKQGNLVLLEEDIIISDARNQSVLRGSLMEWRPLENTLLVKDNLQANHPNLAVTANTAKYATDTESLELIGQVVASTIEPSLLLRSDRLLWQIPQQKLVANNPLNVVRYENKDSKTVTDRLIADKGEVALDSQTVTLKKNVELTSVVPDLQIATNSVVWNYQQRLINSQDPIQVVDRQQQLTVTGNQGEIDFQTEIATMQKGVKAIDNRQQATLYSQQAVWNISKKEIIATENVTYNKKQPQINLTGDRAVIQLQNNKAVVTSNRPSDKPVTSVVSNN